MKTADQILEQVVSGQRLSAEDAIFLFEKAELTDLGKAALAVRNQKHPKPEVTYIIDRNINYTNVCVTDCKFCAFYRHEGDSDAYVLTKDQLKQKIIETQELGGNQILLQGGHNPKMKLDWYVDLLKFIKSMGIHIHAFSGPEIYFFSKLNKMPIREVIRTLRAAGWDSLPGGGAEILTDRVRALINPQKAKVDPWIEVHRTAHEEGMRSTATMMFGHVETFQDRVEHMQVLRDLQDETKGFTAFIPWTFQSQNTAMSDVPMTTSFDYLRTLAISRLFFDNIDNLQASWVTQGPKIGQISLMFGCNDMGSIMIEENVVRNAGAAFRMTSAQTEKLISDAGFTPKKRNFFYQHLN